MVMSEPIQPITPKYMMRIEVSINGARESPKVCARSWVARICRLPARKEYALPKVKTSKAMPIASTVIPEKAILPLKVSNTEFTL